VGFFVLRDLLADVVHVEALHLLDDLDDLVERGAGQRTGLAQQQDALAKHHHRGDRADAWGGARARKISCTMGPCAS